MTPKKSHFVKNCLEFNLACFMGFGYIKTIKSNTNRSKESKYLKWILLVPTIEIHKPKPSLLKSTATLAD